MKPGPSLLSIFPKLASPPRHTGMVRSAHDVRKWSVCSPTASGVRSWMGFAGSRAAALVYETSNWFATALDSQTNSENSRASAAATKKLPRHRRRRLLAKRITATTAEGNNSIRCPDSEGTDERVHRRAENRRNASATLAPACFIAAAYGETGYGQAMPAVGALAVNPAYGFTTRPFAPPRGDRPHAPAPSSAHCRRAPARR